MLRDVIELKQAALWHGGKIRIDQACEAAAEGMVRQPKALRIAFRSEEVRAFSGTHQEHTKSLQTSHLASCVSSSSAVALPQMSGGTCREQSSTDASDSSMCVAATARRDLKEPVAPVERSHEERVTFRWRRFLLLTYLVVTASTAQLCLMRGNYGKHRRQEIDSTQRIRNNRLREERKIPQPETFTHSDTSDHRSRLGSVQTTTNGRLGSADLGLSAPYRTESVSR